MLGALHTPKAAIALTGLALLVLFGGCGGGTAPEARSADSAEADDVGSGNGSSDEAAESSDAEASETRPASSCEDGTCFECGSGSCLTGWYCDESAPGGAACSWLPECAEKAGCGCVARALGKGCSCTDSGGGPHVTCQ